MIVCAQKRMLEFAEVSYFINGDIYDMRIHKDALPSTDTGITVAMKYIESAASFFNELMQVTNANRIGCSYQIRIGTFSLWVYHKPSGIEWVGQSCHHVIFNSKEGYLLSHSLHEAIHFGDLTV